jgi:hypothetical protein
MKKLIFAGMLVLITACNINDILGSGGSSSKVPTLQEMQEALQMALKNGINHGVDSIVETGYFQYQAIRILLPNDVNAAFDSVQAFQARHRSTFDAIEKVRKLGLIKPSASSSGVFSVATKIVDAFDFFKEETRDSLVRSLNRGATAAAPSSVPIFWNAIEGMSFTDARAMLLSQDSAPATDYLQLETSQPLTELFAPVIDSALHVVTAVQYYTSIVSRYNDLKGDYTELVQGLEQLNHKIHQFNQSPLSLLSKVEPIPTSGLKVEFPILPLSLGEWTTTKALDGLFYVVGNEELKIRKDPLGYLTNLGSSLLELVFGWALEERE